MTASAATRRDRAANGGTGPADADISEASIDDTLAQTFPASDPPYWTLGVDAFAHGVPRHWEALMALARLDKPQWKGFFDRVSNALIGKRAEIEVASLDLGAQVEAEWLPLIGIAYDPREDIIEIALEGIDHMIRAPSAVFVDEDERGLVSLKATDAEHRQHIVQLRDPLMLPSPA
jgi:Family of unknown function (DUF5335)